MSDNEQNLNRYHSTHDLCERFRCSSRTIFRRMQREANPFPPPCMQHAGSANLWDAADVAAWERRERERTRSRSQARAGSSAS